MEYDIVPIQADSIQPQQVGCNVCRPPKVDEPSKDITVIVPQNKNTFNNNMMIWFVVLVIILLVIGAILLARNAKKLRK